MIGRIAKIDRSLFGRPIADEKAEEALEVRDHLYQPVK